MGKVFYTLEGGLHKVANLAAAANPVVYERFQYIMRDLNAVRQWADQTTPAALPPRVRRRDTRALGDGHSADPGHRCAADGNFKQQVAGTGAEVAEYHTARMTIQFETLMPGAGEADNNGGSTKDESDWSQAGGRGRYVSRQSMPSGRYIPIPRGGIKIASTATDAKLRVRTSACLVCRPARSSR